MYNFWQKIYISFSSSCNYLVYNYPFTVCEEFIKSIHTYLIPPYGWWGYNNILYPKRRDRINMALTFVNLT